MDIHEVSSIRQALNIHYLFEYLQQPHAPICLCKETGSERGGNSESQSLGRFNAALYFSHHSVAVVLRL